MRSTNTGATTSDGSVTFWDFVVDDDDAIAVVVRVETELLPLSALACSVVVSLRFFLSLKSFSDSTLSQMFVLDFVLGRFTLFLFNAAA